MAARVLLADAHRYMAHPHMVALAGGTWVMVANRAPRRAVVMHPPQDPEFVNVVMRSEDEGETWSPAQPVPGYGVTGTECAGLTALSDGGVLLNQWRFRWYPLDAPPQEGAEAVIATPTELRAGLVGSSELDSTAAGAGVAERWMPWLRGGGAVTISRSDDGGRRFRVVAEVATAPFVGGYGMRGAVVTASGEIILPLCDVPAYRQVFLVRSRDRGRTWSPPEKVAEIDGRWFEEPAPFLLPDGTILMLLRENASRTLFSVRSMDAGATWSVPEPTGIAAYPAHVLDLGDGRIAAIVGRRTPPPSIQAFLSDDGGRTWDVGRPVVIAELPHRDAGYPTAARCADGSVYVAWYQRDSEGVTGLHGRRLRL